MIKLTMENGLALWASQIVNIREPFDYERASWEAGSHIDTYAGGYLVCESPAQILYLLAEECKLRGLPFNVL